jgi:transcriptional regulator of acetoin/glycerol metabolism
VMLRCAATAAGNEIQAADLPEDVLLDPDNPEPPQPEPTDPGREALVRALEASSGKVARAAQTLRVSRMTLYRWLRKHGIER